MKKQISFSTQGQRADIGKIVINRILPNRYAQAVGPFVFLDYFPPAIMENVMKANQGGAHPHRGIATLTYVLDGKGEHFDSRANRATVLSGGLQWMKAGNGIIHDETLNIDSTSDNKNIHGFQFWINLPAINKQDSPDYLAVQASDVPQMELHENSGWIKVIAGAYQNLVSPIPSYSRQYLYHIHLNARKEFVLPVDSDIEFSAFLPQHDTTINDTKFNAGEFVEFDRKKGIIELINTSDFSVDIILFGGEKYLDPIVAQGPFVMNTQQEITEAYSDFHSGKYGEIDYN